MKNGKVRWNPARIKRLYKSGKNVSQIAQAIGCPPATGNNRVRHLLVSAGLCQVAESHGPERKPKPRNTNRPRTARDWPPKNWGNKWATG